MTPTACDSPDVNTPYLAGQLFGTAVLGAVIWCVASGKAALARWAIRAGLLIFVYSETVAWLSLFHVHTRSPHLSYAQLDPVIGVVGAVLVLCILRVHKVWTPLLVAYTLSQLLRGFSYLYWNFGSAKDFDIPLTHLDALYVALGTLSTAGTGNITAMSEAARRIQLSQMFVDVLFVVFAVAIVIARATSSQRPSPSLATSAQSDLQPDR